MSSTASSESSSSTTGESTAGSTVGSTGTTDTSTGSGGDDDVATCPSPLPAEWIFCDDFESSLDFGDRYWESSNDASFHVIDTEAASGSRSVEVRWEQGQIDAGGLKVAFGRNPAFYGSGMHYRPNEDFDEIYWRMRVKHQPGWPDIGPDKLSRATMMVAKDWSQGMIAHLWSQGVVLIGDPASCITGGTVNCVGYNDFGQLDWLGWLVGVTEIFSSADSGQWRCVEGHVVLNTPGVSDGVFEFWIDGQAEAAATDLDWRGTYTDYGINAVFFENYWNAGATEELRRYFDDLAIATVPIGCD